MSTEAYCVSRAGRVVAFAAALFSCASVMGCDDGPAVEETEGDGSTTEVDPIADGLLELGPLGKRASSRPSLAEKKWSRIPCVARRAATIGLARFGY